MKKRKNYFKLFLEYTEKNEIRFACHPGGDIDYITDLRSGESVEPHIYVKFGTKAAYDWLVGGHKKTGRNL